MVKDKQVRMLMKLVNEEELLKTAAAKAGMSEKTARKYHQLGKLPSHHQFVDGLHCRVTCGQPGSSFCSAQAIRNNPQHRNKKNCQRQNVSPAFGHHAIFLLMVGC